jgi:hypothetical protein
MVGMLTETDMLTLSKDWMLNYNSNFTTLLAEVILMYLSGNL